MATRTVRLDEETEKTLARLRRRTGLSISEVLKRGVRAYAERGGNASTRPYEIYRRLDLGPGGWSVAPAKDAKRAIRSLLRRRARR